MTIEKIVVRVLACISFSGIYSIFLEGRARAEKSERELNDGTFLELITAQHHASAHVAFTTHHGMLLLRPSSRPLSLDHHLLPSAKTDDGKQSCPVCV